MRLEDECIDYAELMILGARAKARQLPDRSQRARLAREQLAHWILTGTGPKMDVAAADLVKRIRYEVGDGGSESRSARV